MQYKNQNHYYRNKYAIGLYTNDIFETCVTIVDNKEQFAKIMGISVNNATVILHKLFNKENNCVVYGEAKVKVEFVDMFD